MSVPAVFDTLMDSDSIPGATFVGTAMPGTKPSQPGWQIQKNTESQFLWGENGAANLIWNNRAKYKYGSGEEPAHE